MPPSKLRLTIVVDRELQRGLRFAAKRHRKSVSAMAASLLRDALERDEDLFLARLSERRERTGKRAYSEAETWHGRVPSASRE